MSIARESEQQQSGSERYEIRFSGSGGQGIITLAVIFAEAVGVYSDKYVCQTQSYGPEARGGKSKSEVVISNRPIDVCAANGPRATSGSPKSVGPTLIL